jgi:hypothetical protein
VINHSRIVGFALGLLGIATLMAGCSKAVSPTTTTTIPATTTSPPTTATTTTVSTKTTVTPTTTAPASPYPNGEEGDKDFAVQSIQEHTEGLGAIGGTIRITNVGTKSYTVTFTVTFFATKTLSGQPLGYAQGSADRVAPGQTVTEALVSQNSAFTQTQYWYQFQVDTEMATTSSTATYPSGEIGDKDFAVKSLHVADDGQGDIGGTIRITNVGTQSYSVSFTVTFFATKTLSGQPLGYAQGSAEGVAPGQTVTETLVSPIPMFSRSNFYYEFQVDTEF